MRRWPSWLAVLAAPLALSGHAAAQSQNTPHAGYVYPAGGRQGSTLVVRVGGRFLDGVSGAVVSGRGLRVELQSLDKPLTGMALNDLRDKVAELQKTAKTPEDRQEIAAIRMQIGESQRRSQNPVLSEIATLAVTIDADAPPGPRQIRLQTTLGLTNPVTFCVGQLPEFTEVEDKNAKADGELAITLPATVNGRIIPGESDRAQFPLRQAPQYMPGDVDRFRFPALAGQELVCIVSARELMPYLADAVPGWFQATLTLYDHAGRQVAYGDHYRFQPDPVLHVRIPADGEYVLEIKDALYRGREDFVYRIAIGELPFITGIFPLGAAAGTKAPVAVEGWNLRQHRVTMDASTVGPGVYPLSSTAGPLVSNPVPFAVDTLPEVTEHEPNDTLKDAQRVTLPVIVNGRIQVAGDVDVFAFQGRAGATIVAETTARRLGSPLDSSITLMDAQGRRLAFNDDADDKASGLLTHQADSRVSATLPADGMYFVRVADVQHQGGPEFGYRLRIGPPRPDFELRVSPAEINAGAGTTVPVTLTAIRRDGFDGDIALALKDASDGFTLSGGVIPGSQSEVRVTLTVPPVVAKDAVALAIEGRAAMAGRTVTRRAVAADDMMQAFAYHHLVAADALHVSVIARGTNRTVVRVLNPQAVKVPVGGAGHVRVAFTVPRALEQLAFDLDSPPDGVSVAHAVFSAAGGEFDLVVDPAKVKPGLRGNLIVTVSGERTPAPNQPASQAARRRVPVVSLPAIPFEVVQRP